MRGIGLRTEMPVDIGNHIIQQDIGEADKGHIRHGSVATLGEGERTGNFSVFHHYDERLAFPLVKQIVQDPAAAALAAPTGLILGITMLEI